MSARVIAFPIARVPIDRRWLLPEVQARVAELEALLKLHHDERKRIDADKAAPR